MNEVFAENISNFRFLALTVEQELTALLFDEDFEQRRFISPLTTLEEAASFFESVRGIGHPRLLLMWNAAATIQKIEERLEAGAPRHKLFTSAETVLDLEMLANALSSEQPVDVPADASALQRMFLELLAKASDRVVARGAGLTLEALIDLSGGYYVFGRDMEEKNRRAKNRPFRMPPRLAALENLCGTETRIMIEVAGDPSPRQVTPLEVRLRGSRVFVDAWCHRDGARLSFRGDRIIRVVRHG